MGEATAGPGRRRRGASRLGPCTIVAIAALSQAVLRPALAETCVAPERPAMPDGATATMDDMLAGQEAVKTFQASNMEYMHCLERSFNAAKAIVSDASDAAARAIANAEYAQALEAYNAAVSAEEEVAGAFNIELREYRAANR